MLRQLTRLLAMGLIYCCCVSCKPKIFLFDALPLVITPQDSVHLNWKVRGKPELSFYQKKVARPFEDSVLVYEYTLISRKGKKEPARKTIQVELVPVLSRDRLVFPVKVIGDTLIASGIKDSLRWCGFQILTLASIISRNLRIIHAGMETELTDSGKVSAGLEGARYCGPWEIHSAMTAAEKSNLDLIPERFQLEAIIEPQKK